MKKTTIAAIVLIIIAFVLAIYLYPKMPEQMASHWNGNGEVNGHMPKFWGLFLMPIISLACLLLFIFIPRIDPLKKNIKKFINYYDAFVIIILAFLFYIYLLTLAWNLGTVFNMTKMIIPPIGVLIYFSGILIQNAKRNWFIGIRTPWTLSNEVVWKKTHRIGAKLFKTAGVIIILSLWFQSIAIWLVLISVLIAALYPIFYSYFEYQRQIKK